MKNYLITLLLIASAMLYGIDLEQYSGFPINLSDAEAAPPNMCMDDDITYIGLGGSDSTFHIIALEYPSSYHQLTELDGPVSMTAAATYDNHFAVQTENGLLYLINNSGIVVSGFPVDLGGNSQYTSPIVLPDGTIIAIAGNSVYSITPYGVRTHIADFESPYGAIASPAAGDIDVDGDIDIVVAGWDAMYAFDMATGESIDAFPIELEENWYYSYSAPVIADLENDGEIEVIVGIHQTIADNWGAIMVARAGDGALLSYPVALSRDGSWIYATPAIADMDQDLLPEINYVATDGYVYSLNADRSSSTIFKSQFYVTSGSLQGSPVMLSTNGDRIPEYHFVSADTGKIVRRKFDGFEPDTFDLMCDGSYGLSAPLIFQARDGEYLLCSSTIEGQLNMWTLTEDAPLASPKWLHHRGSNHCEGIYAEPPGSLWVRDTGDYFRVSWTEPKAYTFPPDSYTLYRPDPADEDSTALEIAYSGTDLSVNTTVAFDSTYIYVTAHYPNGTESIGRSILVYEGEGIAENFDHNRDQMIMISPNPFNGTCNISSSENIKNIVITDTNGRTVIEYKNVSRETSVFFDNQISSGVYLVHLIDNDGTLAASKKAVYLK